MKRRTPIKAALATITRRITFRPPPVEPAHAPTSASTINQTRVNCGQRSKSAVPKPVLVCMQTTWKALSRKASQKLR